MNGEILKVEIDNDHLGQIISGQNQYQKNVDLRLTKAKKCIFSLLGPCFSFKNQMSPAVKLHIFRTFTCPVLRSGLATFALRKYQIESISLFQRKVLKSICKLSDTAPTPGVHFITGEPPIEAEMHYDAFILFFCVWSNPNSKIYNIVKYLTVNSYPNSHTWTAHIKYLSEMYSMENPVICLTCDQPTKFDYKSY